MEIGHFSLYGGLLMYLSIAGTASYMLKTWGGDAIRSRNINLSLYRSIIVLHSPGPEFDPG